MRTYCITSETLLKALWGPKWEGNPRKRGYMYTCAWFTLLYSRNWPTVKQLYSRKKKKKLVFHLCKQKSTATSVPLGIPPGSTHITVWRLTYLSSWTPGLCGAPWGLCTGGWHFLSGTQRAVGSSPGNRGNRSRTSTEASTTHFSVIKSSWWRQKRTNIQSEFCTQEEALGLQKMKETPSFLRSLM